MGMAARFHTGVDWWLSLELAELAEWIEKGGQVLPPESGEE